MVKGIYSLDVFVLNNGIQNKSLLMHKTINISRNTVYESLLIHILFLLFKEPKNRNRNDLYYKARQQS